MQDVFVGRSLPGQAAKEKSSHQILFSATCLIRRRCEQETKAFKERNNIRAGIESTNAEMKKSQGLGKLRVRSQPRVDQTVIFKALACNFKRMVKYVRMLPKHEPSHQNVGNLAVIPANC